MEFGLVVIPFIMLIGAIFNLGMMNYRQQMLDTALQQASRNLLVGVTTADTANEFKEAFVCPAVSMLMNCDDLDVGAAVVNGDFGAYWSEAFFNRWCPGEGGDMVIVGARYATPADFMMFRRFFGEANADRPFIQASFVIRREPTTTGGTNACE